MLRIVTQSRVLRVDALRSINRRRVDAHQGIKGAGALVCSAIRRSAASERSWPWKPPDMSVFNDRHGEAAVEKGR